MAKWKEQLRRFDWGNHLLNFIGTCLGVLLALYLSNYQQNQRDHQRLQIAIKHIALEIKENYKKTKNHLEQESYHLAAIEAIRNLVNEQDSLVGTEAYVNQVMKEFPDIFSAKKADRINDTAYYWNANLNLNFKYLQVSDIAWKNAQAMDVMHLMDFKEANELYTLYNTQAQILLDVEKAIDILKSAPGGNNNKSGLDIILQDYHQKLSLAKSMEKGLLEYYTEVLKELQKEGYQ